MTTDHIANARVDDHGAGVSNRAEMRNSLQTAQACTPVDAMSAGGRTREKNASDVSPRHWLIDRALSNEMQPGAVGQAESHGQWQEHQKPSVAHRLSVLLELLERRQSALTSGRASGAVLRELLHLLSFRRLDIEDAAGRSWQSRYYPSAGGTHCIEPLLYVHDADDHPNGWFCQIGPRGKDLRSIVVPEADSLIATSVEALRLPAPPSAIIFAVADPEILLARYPQGSSLLWRDAGAFLGIAHLCCCQMGFSATIVGIAGELSRRTNGIGPHVVGALAIGGVCSE